MILSLTKGLKYIATDSHPHLTLRLHFCNETSQSLWNFLRYLSDNLSNSKPVIQRRLDALVSESLINSSGVYLNKPSALPAPLYWPSCVDTHTMTGCVCPKVKGMGPFQPQDSEMSDNVSVKMGVTFAASLNMGESLC